MRGSRKSRILLAAILVLAVALAAPAADPDLVSSMRNVSAVAEAHGFRLNPAYDSAQPIGAGDLAAPQAFEILRPDGKPLVIGRMFTSCTCIQLEAPKRSFAQGERAVFQLRNIKPTPLNGQIYAMYVQIVSPIRTTLRFDTFVQSQSVILPPTETEDKDKAAADGKPDAATEELAKADEGKADEVKAPDDIEVIQLAKPATDLVAQAAAALADDEEEAEAKSAEKGEAPSAPPSLDTAKAEMDAFFKEKAEEASVSVEKRVDAEAAAIGEYRAEKNQAAAIVPPPPPAAPAAPAVQAAPKAPEAAPAPAARPEVVQADVAPGEPSSARAVSLITIGVKDMARSIRFYEELGWRRASRNKYDQTAFFQLRGQVLALYPLPELLKEQNMESAKPAPGGITLAIHLGGKAEVLELYEKFIAAGGKALREPTEMPSGAVTSYVADPDGNPWEISWVPQFRVDEEGGLWLP